MKSFKFTINGNQYEVEVLEIDGNMARIEVNGTMYDVELHREVPQARVPVAAPPPAQVKSFHDSPRPAPAAPRGPAKASEVRAPLPGVIVQVMVRPGDEVKTGQTVCTLETMKMENAIKSETAGKVTAVNITPGQTVLQDEVLIVIG